MNNKNKFPFWVFLPVVIPIGLAVALVVKLICIDSCLFSRWLGFAYWALVAFVVLFVVWMGHQFYSKLVETLHKQQLECEKLKKEKTQEEEHNKFRITSNEHEYSLRKQAANDKLLLELVDKLSDRKTVTNTEEGKEVKTIKLSFRQELLDELKAIKLKWDEMKDEPT